MPASRASGVRRVLLVGVPQRLEVRMTRQRRVVERDLGVEADQPLDGVPSAAVSRTMASGLISTRSAS